MEHKLCQDGYGTAAFAILEQLLPQLTVSGHFTRAELADTLAQIAQTRSSRGLAMNSDAETTAARLIFDLENKIRHLP